jgi:transcriptional regulator with XRE-family HTH domain
MPYHALLRALRVRWALSQGEVAELLDISQARISRYEKGEEPPTLQAALGLQVIFGPAPRKLFPYTYATIEEAVMGRAADLERRLLEKPDSVSARKRELLASMMDRATKRGEA